MPERGRPRKPRETAEEKKARLAKELTDGRRLVSADAAAHLLGLSTKTVYGGTCNSKDKPPFPVRPKRYGRRVMFDIKDLNAYVDNL